MWTILIRSQCAKYLSALVPNKITMKYYWMTIWTKEVVMHRWWENITMLRSEHNVQNLWDIFYMYFLKEYFPFFKFYKLHNQSQTHDCPLALVRLTIKKHLTSEILNFCELTHKGQCIGKAFPCHEAIMKWGQIFPYTVGCCYDSSI